MSYATEISPLLCVGVLKDDIETRRRNLAEQRDTENQEKSMRWLNMCMQRIDHDYVREKITMAGVENRTWCQLIEMTSADYDSEIDYQHLYYSVISPYSESLENRLIRFVNTKTTRLYAARTADSFTICLDWGVVSKYLPITCYTHPYYYLLLLFIGLFVGLSIIIITNLTK